MAYHFDNYDNSVVIDGFEKGIADNPYEGLADMRCVNTISIPKEVSVGFSTSQISPLAYSGSMTNSSASADTVSLTNPPDSGQAIQFSVLSDLTKGLSLNTTYWAVGSSSTFQLYDNYALSSLINITGDGLTGTWASVNMSQPKHFAYASKEGTPSYWLVDSAGQVWSNARTSSSNAYWTFTGNKPNNSSNGNGLVYYAASDGTGYMFVFSDNSIDFTPTVNTGITWTYQWSWLNGTAGSYNANPTVVLKSATTHNAFNAPTNQVVFCDGSWIGRWYETNPATAFVPTTLATYTADQTHLLPSTDTAQCLSYLGTNYLVGGKSNIVYPWNGTATTFNYPILLAESDIKEMVTINTNTFMLVGNRGRIYVTNGTNANLYKKIPDHISGTVEPYFIWGGLTSIKNQIYFSARATTNSFSNINQYGGVWAIDVDTKALRLTHKLSYGTYAGYAPCIIPNFSSNPAGTGLFIGWDNGSSGYGLDGTQASPYLGGQTTIDSDLIPIGTFEKPRDLTKIEYRLTRPLVSGESIVIKTRLIFNTTDTGYTTTLTDSTAGNYSNVSDINFKNAQWCQFQVVLTSIFVNPSYVRLKEIRIKGLVKPLTTAQA